MLSTRSEGLPGAIGTQEVRLLRELRHDNIVELKGVCSKDPVYALVMSYCPRSLYDVLQARRIPPSLVLEWAKQIATGMDYLHDKGIIHRDLKSPNVLVAQDQRTLKISDFGTSMEMPLKSTKMSFKGTCAWMAPELLRGEKCGQKVDVYSFGVCLWELLTSEVPYHGVDVGAIIWGVGSGRLSLPVPESTPDGFTLLLRQCWNKEAKHRPAFRQILMHLSILQTDTEFAATPDESYFQTQLRWKREIQERFEEMKRFEDSARHKHDDLLRHVAWASSTSLPCAAGTVLLASLGCIRTPPPSPHPTIWDWAPPRLFFFAVSGLQAA